MKILLLVALSALLSAGVITAQEYNGVSLFTDPESNQLTGEEGESFNVSCEGFGGRCSKFTAMKWTGADGKEITATQRNPKTAWMENRLYLIFSSPKLRQSGSYKCSGLYGGRQQLERQVFIEFFSQERIRGRKPKFQSTAYNASVEQGLNVRFLCSAESKLPLTYDWFTKAGDKISSDPTKRVFVTNISSSSVLTLNGVQQKEDEGQYICMAKNMNGLETKFYHLEVLTDTDAWGIRMVTDPGRLDVKGLEGKPVNVSCEAAGGDKSKFSDPIWKTIDGEEISEGDPSATNRQGKAILTFMNPRINDSSSFLCTAVYDNEVEIQSEVFLEIYGYKPEFPFYSEDIVVDEGGWLRVPCKAKGEWPITYNWYDQNADKITEATNATIYATHKNNQSYLTFTDVSMEDRGAYTCSASNSHGQVNKVYNIRVLNSTGMKPEFRVSFENVTGRSGQLLEIPCLAMGERPITYNWYNQEEDKIPDDDRSSVYARSGKKYSILFVQKLSLAHRGTYTCTASNTHGLVSKVYMIDVVS